MTGTKEAKMVRILIADKVAPACAERLKAAGFQVDLGAGRPREETLAALASADGLVVRSATKVDTGLLDGAPGLKAIGRAGEGVDNIDVAAATERGIVVMNTPGGNTISAAEHTLGLLIALARRIPEADRSMRDHRWERGRFLGVELLGKSLGIIGLGKIGREVAARARGFGMQILGHDPHLSEEQQRQINVEPLPLARLLERADFLTVHTPLTDATRHLIGEPELRAARRGIRLINCARGGIYDEAAVAAAIRDGRVAGAAFDVFETEPPSTSPLIGLDEAICTPHLGASTHEAQEKVAVRIADQMIELLRDGVPRHALNLATVEPALRPRLDPYRVLAAKLGRLQAYLVDGPVEEIRVEWFGEVLELPSDPLLAAVLTGYLRNVLQEPVNEVNA
ncbi:MAG: phosphoglycerate dehydrogenase, partial [Acidobacteriota bacterium]